MDDDWKNGILEGCCMDATARTIQGRRTEMINVIKENWVAFYILGLSIVTAIGKHMIRKHVWKENGKENRNE